MIIINNLLRIYVNLKPLNTCLEIYSRCNTGRNMLQFHILWKREKRFIWTRRDWTFSSFLVIVEYFGGSQFATLAYNYFLLVYCQFIQILLFPHGIWTYDPIMINFRMWMCTADFFHLLHSVVFYEHLVYDTKLRPFFSNDWSELMFLKIRWNSYTRWRK